MRRTVAADEGEKTAIAAVNGYLIHVSSGERIGLRPMLAEDRRDDLVRQWEELRRDMERSGPPAPTVTHERYDVTVIEDGRVQVVTGVRAQFPGEGTLTIVGTEHPWKFEVRRDGGGWRIWSADLPQWCGVIVRADVCR